MFLPHRSDAAARPNSRVNRIDGTANPSAHPSPILDPSLCRHFALRGTCRFKSDCHYSHVLPADCADWNEACQRIPCPHYGKAICRYGTMCRLAHGSGIKERPSPQESKAIDEPSLDREGGNSNHVASASEDVICGICLEPMGQTRNDKGEIEHNRKKFGLLSSCDHVFCIQCLRTWRCQQKKETLDERDSPRPNNTTVSDRVRACPACRQPSDFIVPSYRYCMGEEKEQVVASYKARLSCTPCKRFNGKMGSCPFGSDCFYAHWNRQTGEDVKEKDKSKQELWQEKAERHRLKAERRQVLRRRRMFPQNMTTEEMQVMEDLIYLTSMQAFLNPLVTSNEEDSYVDSELDEGDTDGILEDHLVYVDNNGHTTFGRAGIAFNPRHIEAILERLYNERSGGRDP
ncbi:zinc finger domain containing protein [Nitzschia inconspicua]|uniref:Zinc finger domain containing protein n=1 Tax=Nitzschia inconspicua TaxID=303405 RepID=A0A9K3LWF2_9STRA|nr:zinc finger domain containing protein [Nitzschia inconspicua]KAG7369788.1 zinc finger domain containing protein [Nitzschia inconspicua]